MANEGIALDGVDFDSMIASYLLNPSSRGHGLDDLAMEYFGHQNLTYKQMVGSGQKEICFDEVEVDRATEYAAEDSDMTWRLKEKLGPKLKGTTLKLYKEIELPLLEVLAEIELNGVHVNRKHLVELSSKIDKELLHFKKNIYLLAGEEFNINSPKQLSVILFEKLKLPVVKKPKYWYDGVVSDVSGS